MKLLKQLVIAEYVSESGDNPYRDWLESLDVAVKARIQARMLRIETSGTLGDHRFVGGGVWELKFDFGAGYRVYFGFDKNTIILLLMGGDKGSQRRDIRKAQKLWNRYLSGV